MAKKTKPAEDDDLVGTGGNGRKLKTTDNQPQGDTGKQLKSFIERIETLEEEKAVIAGDIKDVYGEAKGVGFDAKQIRRIISIRKQDPEERAEQEAILETYLIALGMALDD